MDAERDKIEDSERFAKSSETLLQHYHGEKVLLIADHNHYRSEDIHGFSFKVAEDGLAKGIKGIALEMVPRGQQRLYDDYATGKLSRDNFISIYTEMLHTHMAENERREYAERLANVMDKGIRIYGVGSLAGIMSDNATEPYAQKMEVLAIDMLIDTAVFRSQYKTEIDQSPKAFLDKMIAEVDGRLSSLTPKQAENYTSFLMELQDPENKEFYEKDDHRSAIDELFRAIHPSHEKFEEVSKLVVTPDPRQNILVYRQGDDPKNAAYIKGISDSLDGGLVVVYGLAHTTHDNDIDRNLRRSGVSVMIADIGLGAKDSQPNMKMPPLFREGLSLLDVWGKAAILDDGDPNRFRMPDIFDRPTEIEEETPGRAISRVKNFLGIN